MNDDDAVVTTGGCFCGAVQYEVRGPLRDVVHCHCRECSQLNGNFGSHSKARKKNITLTKDDGLSWFSISRTARRGFCRECGSALFWDAHQQDSMGIVAGSLGKSTGLKTIGHIFVGEKPDFYEIGDSAPQFEGSSNNALSGDYV